MTISTFLSTHFVFRQYTETKPKNIEEWAFLDYKRICVEFLLHIV